MKHFSFTTLSVVAFLACSSMTFLACGGDDPVVENPVPSLSVSPSSLTFNASGGEQSITISSNSNWIVNGAKSWCYVSKTQGSGNSTINIEVEKNTNNEPRSCRLTISVAGCGDQTVDIRQSEAETTLVASPSTLTFGGNAGEKDEFTIKTNASWSISGIPSWLNVPKSGTGETKVKIETTGANDTDTDRSANLVISASGKSATLSVTQKALRVKSYIEPKNLVALYDEIGFELKASGDVNSYKYIIHSGEDVDNRRVTDKEIEEELKQLDERKLADYDPVFFPDWYYSDGSVYYMQSDTKYYICTIAYDSKGNPGALKKEPIKTMKFVDRDNDAYVTVVNGTAYADAFEFECRKEAYCDTYHLIYGNMPRETFTRVLFAFEINYYLKNKKKHWYAEQRNLKIETYYPNNHTFIHYYSRSLAEWPLVVAMPWGVFKDGSVSSDLLPAYLDTSEEENSSSQMRVIPQRPVRQRGNELQKYDKPIGKDRAIVPSDVK